MSAIDFPVPTRGSFLRLLAMFGLAFVVAAVVLLPQFSVSRECRGGAFSARFSGDFDVRRCEVVVRRFGDDMIRIPLPR